MSGRRYLRKMRSYRLFEDCIEHLETKDDKTAYLNGLILKDINSEKEVFKIDLEPFNKTARERIKKFLHEEGVHLGKFQ